MVVFKGRAPDGFVLAGQSLLSYRAVVAVHSEGTERSVWRARPIVGPAVLLVAGVECMPVKSEFLQSKKKPFLALVLRQMGQKNTFFEKQSGEVAENIKKWSKNKPEQTGKQSGPCC